MTVTALDSPRPTLAPLPLPTASEVLALQAVHEYPAISLSCAPPTPHRPCRTATIARLEQLIDDATRRVRAEFGGSVAASVRDDLLHLVDDVQERPTRAAVALYVSQRARLGVGPAPTRDGPSRRGPHLRHPRPGPLPAPHPPTRRPRPHRARGPPVRRRRRHPAATLQRPVPDAGPHPEAAHPHRRRARQGRRAGPASRRLPTHRRPGAGHLPQPPPRPPGPGRRPAEPWPASRGSPATSRRLAGTVQGSHARTPLPTLARLIRPVLQDYLRSREAEALTLLDTRSKTGSDRRRHARGLARRPCRTPRDARRRGDACSTRPGSAATATSSPQPTTSNTPTSSTTPSTRSSRPSCAEEDGSPWSTTAHSPPPNRIALTLRQR